MCTKKSFVQIVCTVCWRTDKRHLLRKHHLGLLVGEVNFVDGVSSVLERDVVVVDVGRKEDFCGVASR